MLLNYLKNLFKEIKKRLSGCDMVFVTAGLGGGCLRGSSLVYTNPKGPVAIQEIQKDDTVYTFDNGKIILKILPKPKNST